MTVNEVIDLTEDNLSNEPSSISGETINISVSEKILNSGEIAECGTELVQKLMALPDLPLTPVFDANETPPQPHLGICKATGSNCLTLVWHVGSAGSSVKLKKYELWMSVHPYQDWKKVGDIEALSPPMSCTLSQIKSNVVNFFAIRAVDAEGRPGPFSLPCNFIQQF